MIANGINVYCLQETWKLGTYNTTIQEHIICNHGVEEKSNRKGRICSGVAIILGTALIQSQTIAGKSLPITSSSNSEFPGRMTCVTLIFLKRSNISTCMYHQKAKFDIILFLCLIYHTVEHYDQNEFNEELDSFIQRSRKMQILCPEETST